ncbi:MAG: 50S ribosomal protein L6 [Elusimicrobia bacterium HGW-Elusimicrobia-2]|nr:MAG: 50S ribosomal protein L6 [Elusimicrobia bacterium HGW-Elusimicrobia-2]
MSRIAKVPVVIPNGVEVQLTDGGTCIKVKGPKGEMTKKFASVVKVVSADGKLTFEKTENSNFGKMMLGTISSIVRSMVKGVHEGFEKKLNILGVGYGFTVKGQELTVACGYSSDVIFQLPKEVKAVAVKTALTLTSFDKEILGKTAAEIRALRPPEPYKGKGIRYDGEIVRKKAGKSAAGAGDAK